uniref:Large ribosomal subunit protein bL9c n=1 Tax=Osmundaria fimbriata TaxID=228265 RepID=A0A1Z1M4E7_OSMFI|nr:ribosomal protein L9 [Osmundaria fimbriata]ARW60919.1 ribosomal protein L9 [Osmundaria fimbriata]
MKRKLKVILLQDEFNKSKKGTIVDVSRGYAFNYLIPNKIAEIATPKKIKHIEMFKIIEKKEKEANAIAANMLKQKIDNLIKITIHKKQGKNHSIFGTITDKDINNWLEKNAQIKIQHKNIKLPSIKTIGIYNINFLITKEIFTSIKLYVVPTNI